jgi:hypothetical protein
MNIQPFSAMLIGSFAGVLSTLGFQYLTPLLKKVYLHDTCGVNNLHGMPGLLSGIIGAIVAATASRENYHDDSLYKFYPSRTPLVNSTEYFEFKLNSTSFVDGGDGRSAGKIVFFIILNVIFNDFFLCRGTSWISTSWVSSYFRFCYCWRRNNGIYFKNSNY